MQPRRPRTDADVPATERAYQAIRKEILDNTLRSGEPVPVDRFVQRLKLSRTPVREAILRLQREGLIEIRPRMGTFVSHLDVRQIRDMYDLRRLLEGHAAKLASVNVPLEAVRKLRDELKAYPTSGRSIDSKGMSEDGKRVHALILEHCGNRALADMLRSMQDHFARFRSVSMDIQEKVLSSHQEHLDILGALERRDGERAEALIHAHFDHAARLLMDNLLGAHSTARVTVAGIR
jgi:DNA-binding GntR family transcriptional regulator